MESSSLSTSFRREYTTRPAGFRTPSPPIQDVEPISPTWSPISVEEPPRLAVKKRKLAELPPGHSHTSSSSSASPRNIFHQRNSVSASILPSAETRHAPPPTQAPSALDLFATVATSPSLAHAGLSYNLSPSYQTTSRRPYQDGRMSKRSRSEVIDAQTVTDAISRPATSHIPQMTWGPHNQQSPSSRPGSLPTSSSQHHRNQSVEEAELLLGFRYGINNSAAKSPVQHPERGRVSAVTPPRAPVSHTVNQFRHYQGPRTTAVAHERLPHVVEEAEEKPDHGKRQVDSAFADSTPQQRKNEIDASQYSQPQTPASGASDAKPRSNRGWPKGKPRPKSQNPPGRPPKKKNATSENKSRATSTNAAVSHSQNTSESQALTGQPIDRRKPVQETRQRATSEPPQSLSEFESPQPRLPRRHSSPPSFISPSLKDIAQSTRMRKRSKTREGEINLCTACQSRSTQNGYDDLWITCNGCKLWYHTACVGFKNEREVRDVDKFYCVNCERDDQKTTCKFEDTPKFDGKYGLIS